MTTLTLDGTGTVNLTQTSLVWRDATNTLVALSDFAWQSVNLDLGAVTEIVVDNAFNNVTLLSLTSDTDFTWSSTGGDQTPFFADGATVGARDLRTTTFDSIDVGALGTLTFDGRVEFNSSSLSDMPVGDKSASDIDVFFGQSDGTERQIRLNASDIYGDVTTDAASSLRMNFGNIFGELTANNDVEVVRGTVADTFSFFGVNTLDVRGTFSAGTNLTSTGMGFVGDNAAQTVLLNGISAVININGKSDFKGGDDVVALNGTIVGDVQMGNGADTLNFTGTTSNALNGGNGDDMMTVKGTIGGIIRGGAGEDNIDMRLSTVTGGFTRGGADNDTIFGSSGNDRLFGDGGNDMIRGGIGRDVMIGGAGADTFIINSFDSLAGSKDFIRDFSSAEGDKIDLSSVAFYFNSNGLFTNRAGEVVQRGRSVQIDEDGDGVADMFVTIQAGVTLSASDFILD
ncbi:MAG: calcium-binding protein [Pseudomonadota bacterium]